MSSLEASLRTLGFDVDDEKVMHAPSGAHVKFVSLDENRFLQLRVETECGAVVAVLAANAIKVEEPDAEIGRDAVLAR